MKGLGLPEKTSASKSFSIGQQTSLSVPPVKSPNMVALFGSLTINESLQHGYFQYQKSPDGSLQRSKMGETQAIAANVLDNTNDYIAV